LLAEELSLPCISFVETFKVSGSNAKEVEARRQTDNGIEILAAVTPLVLTVTNHENNVPRIAKTRDVMMAFRQPVTKFTMAELGDNVLGEARTQVIGLSIPQKNMVCEFVGGESLDERVANFARRVISVLSSA
jgi:electron transfer flavoprotein alpha/beta subunit